MSSRERSKETSKVSKRKRKTIKTITRVICISTVRELMVRALSSVSLTGTPDRTA